MAVCVAHLPVLGELTSATDDRPRSATWHEPEAAAVMGAVPCVLLVLLFFPAFANVIYQQVLLYCRMPPAIAGPAADPGALRGSGVEDPAAPPAGARVQGTERTNGGAIEAKVICLTSPRASECRDSSAGTVGTDTDGAAASPQRWVARTYSTRRSLSSRPKPQRHPHSLSPPHKPARRPSDTPTTVPASTPTGSSSCSDPLLVNSTRRTRGASSTRALPAAKRRQSLKYQGRAIDAVDAGGGGGLKYRGRLVKGQHAGAADRLFDEWYRVRGKVKVWGCDESTTEFEGDESGFSENGGSKRTREEWTTGLANGEGIGRLVLEEVEGREWVEEIDLEWGSGRVAAGWIAWEEVHGRAAVTAAASDVVRELFLLHESLLRAALAAEREEARALLHGGFRAAAARLSACLVLQRISRGARGRAAASASQRGSPKPSVLACLRAAAARLSSPFRNPADAGCAPPTPLPAARRKAAPAVPPLRLPAAHAPPADGKVDASPLGSEGSATPASPRGCVRPSPFDWARGVARRCGVSEGRVRGNLAASARVLAEVFGLWFGTSSWHAPGVLLQRVGLQEVVGGVTVWGWSAEDVCSAAAGAAAAALTVQLLRELLRFSVGLFAGEAPAATLNNKEVSEYVDRFVSHYESFAWSYRWVSCVQPLICGLTILTVLIGGIAFEVYIFREDAKTALFPYLATQLFGSGTMSATVVLANWIVICPMIWYGFHKVNEACQHLFYVGDPQWMHRHAVQARGVIHEAAKRGEVDLFKVSAYFSSLDRQRSAACVPPSATSFLIHRHSPLLLDVPESTGCFEGPYLAAAPQMRVITASGGTDCSSGSAGAITKWVSPHAEQSVAAVEYGRASFAPVDASPLYVRRPLEF
eukprot:gene22900-35099_t